MKTPAYWPFRFGRRRRPSRPAAVTARDARSLLGGLVLAGLCVAVPASAATVQIAPVVRSLEGSVTIDVGTSALGSYSIDLIYDPAVLHVEAIAPGTSPGFTGAVLTNPTTFASGVTRIAGFNSGTNLSSPTGVVNVANVRFKPVGTPGMGSEVDAVVNSITSTMSVTLPVSAVIGIDATLSSRCLLDVDGNGTTQIGRDILFITRTILNVPPVPPAIRAANPTLPPDDVIRDAVRTMCEP